MDLIKMVKEKTQHADEPQEFFSEKKDLVVHNDDFNTFDFVTKTLIEVCDHAPEQAEQCTLIIHFNGKCVVRSGYFDILEPMYREILNRGITATIE
jgi:ATP-dependent Clp protease adaptor protein ClpS